MVVLGHGLHMGIVRRHVEMAANQERGNVTVLHPLMVENHVMEKRNNHKNVKLKNAQV